jgi:hypothetical protein
MKLGTEDRKKLTLLSVLGVVALGAAFYVYEELFASPDVSTSTLTQSVVTGGPTNVSVVGTHTPKVKDAAQLVGTAAAQLDPTLKMGSMLVTEGLVYTGSGRSIFSGTSAAAVAIPKPIAPVRTKMVAQAPVYTPPPGPPPPPPIDLKFFGTAMTGAGVRQAFLLKGEDVFLASAGDVVQRRYKVVTLSANSIVVEDLVNSNRQTLPLLMN